MLKKPPHNSVCAAVESCMIPCTQTHPIRKPNENRISVTPSFCHPQPLCRGVYPSVELLFMLCWGGDPVPTAGLEEFLAGDIS